jgi:hypothetical protein
MIHTFYSLIYAVYIKKLSNVAIQVVSSYTRNYTIYLFSVAHNIHHQSTLIAVQSLGIN